MATGDELLDAVKLLEKQFRFHGMWTSPTGMVPKLKIDSKWDKDTRDAAEAMNRIAVVRCLPDCERFFGAFRPSALDAFKQDYLTGSERLAYVTS